MLIKVEFLFSELFQAFLLHIKKQKPQDGSRESNEREPDLRLSLLTSVIGIVWVSMWYLVEPTLSECNRNWSLMRLFLIVCSYFLYWSRVFDVYTVTEQVSAWCMVHNLHNLFQTFEKRLLGKWSVYSFFVPYNVMWRAGSSRTTKLFPPISQLGIFTGPLK